jgi:hypothetical protein
VVLTAQHLYGSRAIFGDDEGGNRWAIHLYRQTIQLGITSLGYNAGVKFEHDRIVRLLEAQVSEWLSHDGECDCKVEG